jgi:hypothetical protein
MNKVSLPYMKIQEGTTIAGVATDGRPFHVNC